MTALVKCFVSLQNTDDSYLNYFTTIVEKKISDFINILEELCLDGGHQPNFDWTKNSIIYVSNKSPSFWKLMENDIKKWLSFYSLSPERKLSYYPSKNDPERLSSIEKNKKELDGKLQSLSHAEHQLLKNYLIEKDGDIDKLATIAFYILAGKPLVNFVPELIRWNFGCSLNSHYNSPHKDFINLIQYNLVDWEATRRKLLYESESLNLSGVSEVAQWTYIRILGSTGESRDSVLAETIAQKLRPTEGLLGSWRLIEKYCETDPCDPNSIRPDNISNAIKYCKQLDITKLWNNRHQSQESIFLQMISTGLARFSPDILVEKHIDLISKTLYNSQYALYYGVLNVIKNSILLEQPNINRCFQLGNLERTSEIFDGITGDYQSLITQYSFMSAGPFLSSKEQLDYLLGFKADEKVFIDLIENTYPVSSRTFSEILNQDLEEHQILHLIYYANIHKVELSAVYKQFLKENINHTNSFIRQEVFRAIGLYDDIDLLKNFIDSKKIIHNHSDMDSHENFFASLLWLSAIKYEIVDISIAIQYVHPWAYRYASSYLPPMSLSKIAELLDELIYLISQLDIDIPNLTITENISDSYEMDISFFSIDKKKVDQDFIESINSTSESEKEFDKRQKEQYQEFCKYTDYLRDLDIEFILRSMHPKEFEKIANSNPTLCDKWYHLMINHSVTKLADKFYNFGILLAYVYSDTDIKKSIQLWNKFQYSEGYSEITVGEENISLQLMSIWGKSNSELDKYRFNLLDQASSDAQIYNIVFAAILNNNENAIIKYINTKIQKIEPSQVARGVLVAGCLDENPMSEKIFQRFKNYKGLIGNAYNAALYMYERNKWAKHWFEKMISTDSHDDFWCNMVLFTKIVDSRYYIWKKNFTTNGSLYQKFYFSFENKIKNRCNKWEKKRGEKLFGTERPSLVYLYSNNC